MFQKVLKYLIDFSSVVLKIFAKFIYPIQIESLSFNLGLFNILLFLKFVINLLSELLDLIFDTYIWPSLLLFGFGCGCNFLGLLCCFFWEEDVSESTEFILVEHFV